MKNLPIVNMLFTDSYNNIAEGIGKEVMNNGVETAIFGFCGQAWDKAWDKLGTSWDKSIFAASFTALIASFCPKFASFASSWDGLVTFSDFGTS